jgi:hypothetical protein
VEGGLWKWSISLYGSSVRGTWRRKRRLWRWVPLSMGDRLGNLERGSSSRDFWETDEGGSRCEAPLSEVAPRRRPRGKAPLLETLGYKRKALGTGISLHRGSVGQPRMGSSTGDSERWLKWALDVQRLSLSLSLWELCEGNLEWGLPCWGPWRIGRKGSGDGNLFQ